MKIYFGHSRTIDFVNDFYDPIKRDKRLAGHTLIFPHEASNNESNTRSFYKSIDVFIAEISHPATGLGIELGWAYDDYIPIFCFHRVGLRPSKSISCLTDYITEYSTVQELVDQIVKMIEGKK